VNGFGDVVGYSETGHDSQAFLWTGGAMENLNALVTPGGGWRLDAAYGINDKGQIVGEGTYRGQDRGFLLDPITSHITPSGVPEPASFWLLLTAGVIGAMTVARRNR
jgi:probable HAF family extracellular repeat protein